MRLPIQIAALHIAGVEEKLAHSPGWKRSSSLAMRCQRVSIERFWLALLGFEFQERLFDQIEVGRVGRPATRRVPAAYLLGIHSSVFSPARASSIRRSPAILADCARPVR